MIRRPLPAAGLVVLSLVIVAATVTPLWAAVFGGTLKSANAKSGVIVIEPKSGGTKSFTVPASADVQVDGKKATLDKLAPGQTISVTTSKSGSVLKVTARGGAIAQGEGDSTAKPADPKAEPAKPQPPKSDPVASTRPSTNTPTASPFTPKSSGSKTSGTKRSGSGGDESWAQYRGPNRENKSPDTGLLKEWGEDGPELLWTATGLGEGYSSVSVVDGVIYTMGTQGNNEAVFALSIADGKILWTGRTGGGVYQDGTGNGPRGTPTIDGDSVYALGAEGALVCLSKDNGREKWTKNVLREFQGDKIQWGLCESVLIDGNQLIVTPGGRKATMAALNKANGNTLWTCTAPGTPPASYSSAIIVETDGVRQYVNFTHNSIIGVQASNGTLLWGDDHSANGTANCSSPVAADDMVFAASGYGKGGAMVRLSKAGRGVNAAFVYHTDEMKNHHGGMVVLDGHVFGSNDPGIFTCLELKTGNVAWKNRSVGKGSVTYADGHLYVRSENGPMALIEATTESYKEKGRFNQPQRSGRNAWAHPVVAEGKLFLRDQDKLLVYNVKDGK